ncbi:winged helix-turn-helix transcriptional regulator [Kocuria tytonicola]|uniref:Winged helix-turn-helix transcriptional regulator n=1 Tax=Kocuria tytonicola TaxID=2055946 RepID=A0A3L9LD76_9MICC|nr:winged helix-turn-helix transcriptional regulator [Kocuria tytonicola]RLY94917.1 winged helix-turn-helix transcriptional regulator [Kocuria tytonicola]
MSSPATDRAAAGRTDQDDTTRSRVLSLVLAHGPISAAQIAKDLGLTPAAVRRHLDALEAEQIVEVSMVRGSRSGAGRPARRYVVAPGGHEQLGHDYSGLASRALATMGRAGGDELVSRFVSEEIGRWRERYLPQVEAAGSDVEARLNALSAAMSRDGFVASHTTVTPRGPKGVALRSAQLCQGHCPIQDIANEYPEFCEQETELISQLLDVDVRRLSTMAAGAHVCTTHVPLQLRAGHTNSTNHTTARQGGLS